MRVKSFNALRPAEGLALQVASVPYDTVNREEAAALAVGNSNSFLHIVRPEIDLPEGTDLHADEVYQKAKENFDKFISQDILIREETACLYLYRQVMGDHQQRGIVACCNIEDYERGLIKKHEKTRQEKEEDRTRHVRTLNANSGPVFLTYKDDKGIDDIVASVEASDPLYDITSPDGIGHTVWRIDDSSALVEAFINVPAFYIADGHHRSAAAARAGIEKRNANPAHTGDEEYNWFLTVLFPAGQLKILPYNRFVHDLNGLSEEELLTRVKEKFDLSDDASPVPTATRNVSMYLNGRWYGLSWDESVNDDPVSKLDVSRLQNDILAPLLGVDDPRTSTKIDFIGGIRGTDELVKLVDARPGSVAFSMYPCLVDQMIAIADADQIMPPKSTWFEPKLRSGLLTHTLD